jgi:hypothetical protein
MNILKQAAIPAIALSLIGVGAGLIYFPAGLVAVGLLIWIDRSLASWRRKP